jgi:hypothetical protein
VLKVRDKAIDAGRNKATGTERFLSRIYSACFIIGYLACTPVCVAHPQNASDAKTSPDGRYSVITENKTIKAHDYPERRLFLTDNKNKTRIPLKLAEGDNLISRDVDIRWSPKSDSLIINDWFGSNVANAYLYRTTDPQHPLDIQDRLKQLRNLKPEIHEYLHVYVFATDWKNESIVKVRVAESYMLSDSRKKSSAQNVMEARTTYYDWDTLHNLLKRTKQTATLDFDKLD